MKNTIASGDKTGRRNPEKSTGITVPLGALYTETNSVIGEYSDLPAFAEFAKKSGLKVIQLLPVNDTGTQSSPYSGLSAFTSTSKLCPNLQVLPNPIRNLRNRTRKWLKNSLTIKTGVTIIQEF